MKITVHLHKARKKISEGFGQQNAGLGNDQIAEWLLRAAMSEKRRIARKRGGAYGANRRQKTAAHRHARNCARKYKKGLGQERLWNISQGRLMRPRSDSTLLDRLDPDRPIRWRKLISRNLKREIPRIAVSNLNFLDDPIATIDQFKRISRAESLELNAYLDFDDPYCVDAGAYLVIAEIWPQLAQVFRGGKMSLPVQKVLSAIQLDTELSIGLTGVRNHKDVWAFPIQRRRPRGTTADPNALAAPQDREKVADQLCDLLDQWLIVASADELAEDDDEFQVWELTQSGRAFLAQMSGEILDNAERHSISGSHDGDWSTTAFMARRKNAVSGRYELQCHLAFLSVGLSIAETMQSAPAKVRDFANSYSNHHKNAASVDTLLTVVALQDAITTDIDAEANMRGGTGLQDVLDFIGQLGAAHEQSADVRMTIVSGKTCIRLRNPYLLGKRDAKNRRVQWCNRSNDPAKPPEIDIAFDLPEHFAGTLVSIGFTLDPKLFKIPEQADDRSSNN